MKKLIWFLLCFLSTLGMRPAFACDLCAIFNANQATRETSKGFYLGAAEQFTNFGTLQQDGQEVPNTVDQYLNSSISQMYIGYKFTKRIGAQLTVPFIHRSFRRPVGSVIQQSSVSGFGDTSLTGTYSPVQKFTEDVSVTLDLFGGLKLPTGSSSFLREELFEIEDEGGVESGVHGHDLTLGSGSWDGVIGSFLTTRWKRMLFNATVQYAIRSRGAFGYQFANDLQWNAAWGAYFFLNHNFTLAAQARTAGERKGLDNLNGVPAMDTGITSVYLGPEFLFTWRNNLSTRIGADLPIVQDNTALQLVADYRIKGNITWNFGK